MTDENRTNAEEPQSFVVRVWREGMGRWRGKISHVQTRDSRAFTRLEESTKFMAERVPGISEKVENKKRISSLSPSNSFSWLPRKRSLRLALAAVSVGIVAVIAVLFYNPAGQTPGEGMVGTAQGSGLENALIFFLGMVAGGAAVGVWTRLQRKT